MAEPADIWKAALPTIMKGVSGRGAWAALNAVRAITLDDDQLIIGVPQYDGELAGHLKLPQIKRIMELAVAQVTGTSLGVRLIDGTDMADYELVKRRDVERRRLQEAEMVKMRAEMTAKASWETIYEQLGRRFAAVTGKSMPQNRARFYEEALELVAEARRQQTAFDDLGERNFARCLERIAQYAEVPSTIVGVQVLQRSGEL